MTRFYVYKSSKDELEFIEANSLEQFAAHEFDPNTHVFSGVAVDANDFDDALNLYHHPTSNVGEYIMTDEPIETVTRRQIANAKTGLQQSFDSIKAKLDYLRACLKLKAACIKMTEANQLINEASQEFFALHNKPGHIQPDTIFERLSDATIKATIKYHGNTKKSG